MKKKKQEIITNKFIVAFWLIILFWRLFFGFKNAVFGQDVARDLVVMRQHRKTKEHLFYLGPKASVANFYLPPAYYQVHYFLSFFTNNHPNTMKLFTIFLESFTPIILYFVLKKIGLKKYALIGAFLYSISYFPTTFGVQAWNPNTIPFFSSLFLLLMIIYLEKNTLKYLLLATVCLSFSIQFHYQGVVLVLFMILVAIYQLITNFKKFWKNWILVVLVIFLTFIPYFIGEIKSNWQNTGAIINYFSKEHKNYYQRVTKPDYILTFLPSFFEMVVVGKHQPFKFLGRFIFFIGFFIFIKILFQNKNKINKISNSQRWVFIYFISILLMFRIYKGDKISYYMSTIYILPIILLGFLWHVKRKLMIFIIMIIVFLAGQRFSAVNFRNDLKDIKYQIEILEKNLPKKNVAFFFHNQEKINTYIYAFAKFSNIKVDQKSNILVEVCENDKNIFYCSNSRIYFCKNSKPQIYSLLLRDKFKMKTIKVLDFPKKQKFCINTLPQDLKPLYYQYSDYNFEYGSDVLIPEIAKFNK